MAFGLFPNFFFVFSSKALDKVPLFGQNEGQRPDSCPKEDVCKRKTIPENSENFWLSSHLFVTLHPESVHYGVINRESGVNPEQSRCCKPSLSEQTQSHWDYREDVCDRTVSQKTCRWQRCHLSISGVRLKRWKGERVKRWKSIWEESGVKRLESVECFGGRGFCRL